jgi:hypothetical protein
VLLGSGALLRGDGGEGRPPLFNLVTAAVWASGLFRIMLCNGQNLQEGLLAGVAEELIVGHTDLPRSWNLLQLDSRPAAGGGSTWIGLNSTQAVLSV